MHFRVKANNFIPLNWETNSFFQSGIWNKQCVSFFSQESETNIFYASLETNIFFTIFVVAPPWTNNGPTLMFIQQLYRWNRNPNNIEEIEQWNFAAYVKEQGLPSKK